MEDIDRVREFVNGTFLCGRSMKIEYWMLNMYKVYDKEKYVIIVVYQNVVRIALIQEVKK